MYTSYLNRTKGGLDDAWNTQHFVDVGDTQKA